MGWLPRLRGYNSSGYDGVSEPRDRALRNISSPRFSFVLLCMALLLQTTFASWDYDQTSFSANMAHSDTYTSHPTNAIPLVSNSGDDSDNCNSSDDTVDVEKHSTPEPDHQRQEVSQETIRSNYLDGANGRLTFYNASTDDVWVQGQMFNMDPESCSCRCENTIPEEDCEKLFMSILYADLCKHLKLDPDRPIQDTRTGHFIEVTFPWETNEDGFGSDEHNYKEYDEYDHKADRWAYWLEVEARVLVAIHRLGPHEFFYEGTPLRPWEAYHVDNDLTPPDTDNTCPQDDSGSEGALPDDDASKEEQIGQDGVREDISETKSDNGSPQDDMSNGDCSADEEEPDTYEDSKDAEIDSYLRYDNIPFRFKDDAKQKKHWTQNARRRYKLRLLNGDDSELRLICVCVYTKKHTHKQTNAPTTKTRTNNHKYRNNLSIVQSPSHAHNPTHRPMLQQTKTHSI